MSDQIRSEEHQLDGSATVDVVDVHAELEALRGELHTLATRVDSLERGPTGRVVAPVANLIGDDGGDEAGPVGPTTGSTKPPT